jgi:hypothetical protein
VRACKVRLNRGPSPRGGPRFTARRPPSPSESPIGQNRGRSLGDGPPSPVPIGGSAPWPGEPAIGQYYVCSGVCTALGRRRRGVAASRCCVLKAAELAPPAAPDATVWSTERRRLGKRDAASVCPRYSGACNAREVFKQEPHARHIAAMQWNGLFLRSEVEYMERPSLGVAARRRIPHSTDPKRHGIMQPPSRSWRSPKHGCPQLMRTPRVVSRAAVSAKSRLS